jgi:hypothetical protein
MDVREFLYDVAQRQATSELLIILNERAHELPIEQRCVAYNICNLLHNNRAYILEDGSLIQHVRRLYSYLQSDKQLIAVCERILYWNSYRTQSLPGKAELKMVLNNLKRYLPDTRVYPHYQNIKEIYDNYDLYVRRDWLFKALTETYHELLATMKILLRESRCKEFMSYLNLGEYVNAFGLNLNETEKNMVIQEIESGHIPEGANGSLLVHLIRTKFS